jgi:predicted transcriptional regulator
MSTKITQDLIDNAVNNKLNSTKFDKKFQNIYKKYATYYKTDGYKLEWIDEIYLPFWFCKQEIIIETDIEVDRFSRILLELVETGIKTHTELCEFLGIKEDDFTLMQLNFLISSEFLEENIDENNNTYYEITHKGRDFLSDKLKDKTIESVEFEFVVDDLEILKEENFKYFYNDLTNEFFDENQAIDNDKSNSFNGYKAKATHKLINKDRNKNNENKFIEHKNRPRINNIDKTDFVNFFNDKHEKGTFYDYGNSSIESHKRSIMFLILVFTNEQGEHKLEIRHCKSSVNKFNGETIENKLSQETDKYCKENINFLPNLQK